MANPRCVAIAGGERALGQPQRELWEVRPRMFTDNPNARDSSRRPDTILSRCPSNGEDFFVIDVRGPDEVMKGTNHKRARTNADLDGFRQLQLPFTTHNEQQEHHRYDQPHREGLLYTQACEQRRSPWLPVRNAQPSVDYAAREMSPKSSGKRRRTQHPRDITLVEDIPDDPLSPPTLRRDGEDSADLYENEGEVVAAKRVKSNTGRTLRQHSIDVDVFNVPKSTYLRDAGFRRVLQTEDSREPSGSASRGNACEHPGPHERKDPPKKKASWTFKDRYSNANTTSLPDFSPPRDITPVAAEIHRPKRMPLIGGVRPINKLVNSNQNSIVERPIVPTKKTFDLHDGYPRLTDNFPNKRQKLGGGPGASNGSVEEYIDLEDQEDHGTTSTNRNGRALTVRSGQSQTYNGSLRINGATKEKNVREYGNVERLMDPKPGHSKNAKSRKKLRHNSSSPDGISKDEANSLRSSVARKTPDYIQVDLDDPNDPVSDRGSPTRHSTSRSYPQVVITQSYRGTAFKQPARPKSSAQVKQDSVAPSAKTSSSSNNITTSHGQSSRTNSVSSHSVNDSDRAGNPSRDARQQRALSGNHKNAVVESRVQCEDDDSLDDLNKEDHVIDVQEPQEQVKSVSRVEKGTSHPRTLARDGAASVSTKGDIQHTLFPNPKRAQPGYETFGVVEIFSEEHIWVFRENNEPYSLYQESETGMIKLRGNAGVIKQFELAPISISKIMWNLDSPKLVIHKSKDSTLRGAVKLHVELHSPDQSSMLKDTLKSLSPQIGVNVETKLENIFTNSLKIIRSASRRQKEKPADLELIEENSRRRALRRQDAMKSRRNLGDINCSDADSSRKRTSLARSMRTRSSSEPLEMDEPQQLIKNPLINATSFYGKSQETTLPSMEYSHGTRSSTRVADRSDFSRPPPKQRSPSPDRWTEEHPGWEKRWRGSIIYPPNGKNKATVDKQDIERLDEGSFLNDNLILFYLLWLEQRLKQNRPDLAKRIYFYNTYFYASLTKATKGRRGINYEAVQRWTSKVDLFSFDYLIVPVNENTHWYVAIICNAPKLLVRNPSAPEDSKPQEVAKLPESRDSDGEDIVKPLQSSPESPKLAIPESSELKVNARMKEMTLQDNSTEDTVDDERPNDNPETAAVQNNTTDTISLSTKAEPPEPGPEETTAATVMGTESVSKSPSRKSTLARKGKRMSSTIAPRKYDPTEPRIITLDSLGLRHSPTCTNLKEYLIAEIKSKRGIDIPPPGPLGMTANNIPQQDNYCDCGVFVLSYVEKFLERPDEFIRGILQNEVDVEWPKASDKRTDIREILFQLQKEKLAESQKTERDKSKHKHAQKFENDTKRVSLSNSESDEQIKPSQSGSRPDRSTRDKTTGQSQKPLTKRPAPEQSTRPDLAHASEEPSVDVFDLDEDNHDPNFLETRQGRNLIQLVKNTASSGTTKNTHDHEKDGAHLEESRTKRLKTIEDGMSDSADNDHVNFHRSLLSPSRDVKSPATSADMEVDDSLLKDVRLVRELTPFPRTIPRSPSLEEELEPVLNELRSSAPPHRLKSATSDESVVIIDAKQKSKEVIEVTDSYASQEMLLDDEIPQTPPNHVPNVRRLESSPRSTRSREHANYQPVLSPSRTYGRPKSSPRERREKDSRRQRSRVAGRDGLDQGLIEGHSRNK